MSEVSRLYPGRPISNFGAVIKQLEKPIDTEALSSEEYGEVLAFEEALYTNSLPADDFPLAETYKQQLTARGDSLPELEDIWRKNINSNNFGLGYFLTEAGKQAYSQVFGETLEAKTLEEIEKTLRQNDLSRYSSKVLNRLDGDSVDYEEQRVLDEFAARNFESVEGIEEPQIIGIKKNPDAIVEKAKGYRLIKSYLKAAETDIKNNSGDNNAVLAKKLIISKYRQRVNFFLASLYPEAFSLVTHFKSTDDSETLGRLKELQKSLPALKYSAEDDQIARFLQRIDRFRHGAVYDDEGNLTSIDPDAAALSQDSRYENGSKPTDRGAFSSIDLKVLDIKLDAKTIQEMVASLLETEDLLSEYEEYDTDRETRAPDDKWQAVVSEKFKSLGVDGKQAAIKIPDKKREVKSIIPIVSHEFAHVLQQENKRRIGELALMREVGVDNATVFLEAGAKWWEKETKGRLTGEQDLDIAGTSYLDAIRMRVSGGSFAECMQAFFEDFKRRNPQMTVEDATKRAVNRTRRIYRSGGVFVKGTNYLTNSQPLNYLEQEVAVAELPPEKRYLLLLGGVSLKTAVELRDAGLLDLSELREPQQKPWGVLAKQFKDIKP